MDILIERSPDKSQSAPVYRQIVDQVRAQVGDGRLGPGTRLPAIRALAARLELNRDTVSLAYEQLVREGVVVSQVGRGTFVRERTPATSVHRPPLPQPNESPARGAGALAEPVERLLQLESARPRYDARDGAVPLHSLVPDPSLYPIKSFRRALNNALNEGGTDLLVYGGHRGEGALREAIAARLVAYGAELESDNVVLCQGASQGVSLAMRLYVREGESVAVEAPTYHNVLGVITGLGLNAVAVPMTPRGPDLDALDRALARPEVKLFYTMPSFHNPMGITIDRAHRMAMLEIAARHGKPLIEDAFEMDLRYSGRPVLPLIGLAKGTAAEELVVHLFSFSKSLFPGVRIGSVTARGRAVDGLLALKYSTDLSGVPIVQAAVAEFVTSGGYDRHLTRLRKTLRKRRDVMLEALAREMPEGSTWTRPDGGYQVWVEVPEPIDTRLLLADCARAGLLFAPGHLFHQSGQSLGHASRGLRLTTALADSDEIARGIAILGQATKQYLRQSTAPVRGREVHV